MKINWFSPLPPARSELARQTIDLLPALAAEAEVTLWSSVSGAMLDAPHQTLVKQFDPAHPPWREINAAEVTFYQMGNDPRYHETIWRVSAQHPGIVILHDIKLQHFFAGLIDNGGLSRRDYLALLERHYGMNGRVLGEAFLHGHLSLEALAAECPLTEAAIENALAVVVHWEGAFQSLSEKSSVPVVHLPLARSPLRTADETRPRVSGEPYRIIVFGFLGPNRRLPALLNALAQLPGRERFRLDVYGTMEGEEKMQELVAQLRLTSQVTLHGFVPDEELEKALRQSDLAVNLRNPTMGEASASQLHLWHHGVPTLVTRDGWYAGLPEETVAFVRPDHEGADLRQHLLAFLETPERYRSLGKNGRRQANEQHTVQAYVEGLLEAAARLGEFQGNWIARHLAQRAGRAMSWEQLGEVPPLFGGVAEQIRALAVGRN